LPPILQIMETQERILHKSHELYMKYGIRSVSMDEIAAHLGISKKTIYQYYADKDALVAAVVDIEINNTECECGDHKNNSENAIHEIFLAMDMLQEMFANLNPSIIYDLEKYHPKTYKRFMDHHNRFMYGIIKDNLERGKSENIYRQDINTDIIARFRLASMFSIFNTDFFPHGKYQLANICNEMTNHFLHGLINDYGKALIVRYKNEREIKTTTI
jgi:TetR/AcrR family transcriptional regulator, cholesterol catabolism regulator